jgi:hypothetical protein
LEENIRGQISAELEISRIIHSLRQDISFRDLEFSLRAISRETICFEFFNGNEAAYPSMMVYEIMFEGW